MPINGSDQQQENVLWSNPGEDSNWGNNQPASTSEIAELMKKHRKIQMQFLQHVLLLIGKLDNLSLFLFYTLQFIIN